MSLVLIVEDEIELAELVSDYLEKAGYTTFCLHTGKGVVDWIETNSPDLVILDLMLPVKDGISICKEVRKNNDVPIIMATAKISDIERILGLQIGADDYICKPYNINEVVARVAAILRRINVKPSNSCLSLSEKTFCLGYLSESVELTKLEFELFKLMYNNPERIYSRQKILELVYHDVIDISDRAIDSHIKKIRKKIKLLGVGSPLIESVYGAGYRYVEPTQ